MAKIDLRTERDVEVEAIMLEIQEVFKDTYKDGKYECFLTNLKEKFNVTIDRFYLINGLDLTQLADHIYLLQQQEKVQKPDTPFKVGQSIYMAVGWWYTQYPIDEIKWMYKKNDSAVDTWIYRSGGCFLPHNSNYNNVYCHTPFQAIVKMLKNQVREFWEKAKNS